MAKEEYAAYAVMLGIYGILVIVTSLALQNGAQRYIPELISHRRYRQVAHFTFFLMLIRILSHGLGIIVVFLSAFWFCNKFNLMPFFIEFKWWGIPMFFMGIHFFNSLILEIYLLQKIVKWVWIGVSVCRFIFIAICIKNTETLTLISLIKIEAIAYGIGVIALWIAIGNYLINLQKLKGNEDYYFVWKRLFKYSFFSYFVLLIRQLYSPASNRLLIGKFLQPTSIASFGFAQSLNNTTQRYSPSFLLRNMLMPVLMGKFSEKKDFDELNSRSILIFKINCMLFAPIICLLTLMGNDFMAIISANKYTNSGWILLSLIIILQIINHNQILEIAANAGEKTKLLFNSDCVVAVFFIPIIPLLIWYGIGGVLFCRFVSFLVRDIFLTIKLANVGIIYKPDWLGYSKILTGCFLTICVLYPFIDFPLEIIDISFFSLVTVLICIIFLWLLKPFTKAEREQINSLLGKNIFIF